MRSFKVLVMSCWKMTSLVTEFSEHRYSTVIVILFIWICNLMTLLHAYTLQQLCFFHFSGHFCWCSARLFTRDTASYSDFELSIGTWLQHDDGIWRSSIDSEWESNFAVLPIIFKCNFLPFKWKCSQNLAANNNKLIKNMLNINAIRIKFNKKLHQLSLDLMLSFSRHALVKCRWHLLPLGILFKCMQTWCIQICVFLVY